MTREEIMSIVPGRELDCLIAEKVFNIKINKTVSRLINECVSINISDVYGDDNLEPVQTTTVNKINNYSTSISAAWEVAMSVKIDYIPVLKTEEESAEWICKNALLATLID